MPEPVRYKRTQYLVDPKYQLQFVTRIFLIILLIAILSCLLTSFLLWKNLYLPEHESSLALVSALIAVATTLLLELLLAIPLVFIMGIRQSHRIVGPMQRIKDTLKAIGEGNYARRVTLREGDALEDLATAINAMADTLQRRYPPPPAQPS